MGRRLVLQIKHLGGRNEIKGGDSRRLFLFSVPTGGIGSWLTEQTHDDVFERIGRLNEEPLSAVQLNQLLVLGHEAPVGDGFFRYYWLQTPEQHP